MAIDAKLKTDTAIYDASEIFDYIKDLESITGNMALKKLAKSRALTSLIVFADVIDHFEKELGPDGAWKPWSSGYAASRRKEGKGGNKILQDTGNLKKSFIPGSVAGARVGKSSIVWFNKASTKSGFPYAAHHDEEAKTTRKFMWLSNSAMEKAGNLLLDFALNPRKTI